MLEHPEITRCQRTGYSSWNQPKPTTCDNCGEEITNGEVYDDNHHEYLCLECLISLHRKDWW